MHSPVLAQSDLQRQIDACGSLLACKIDIPYGTHVIYSPWNLRDKLSVEVRAPVGTQVIFFFLETAPPVCIDTTGTRNIVIEGVTFGLGNTSKRPDVLWLHGRPADSRSQTFLGVTNAEFGGWFTKAAVIFIAVENEEMHSVKFWNGIPNTTALFLGRDNPFGVTSPFGPVRVDLSTMTCTNHLYQNCVFGHVGDVGLVAPANNDQGVGLTLGNGVYDLAIIGGSTTGGARGAVLRMAGPNIRRIAVIAPNWEAKGARATIVVDGYVYGLTVQDGLLQAAGPAIQVNGTVENLLLHPAEMLTGSIIQLGPTGKLRGRGLALDGFAGQ